MYLERKHYERVGLWCTENTIAVAAALVERKTLSPTMYTRIFRITFNLNHAQRRTINMKTLKNTSLT